MVHQFSWHLFSLSKLNGLKNKLSTALTKIKLFRNSDLISFFFEIYNLSELINKTQGLRNGVSLAEWECLACAVWALHWIQILKSRQIIWQKRHLTRNRSMCMHHWKDRLIVWPQLSNWSYLNWYDVQGRNRRGDRRTHIFKYLNPLCNLWISLSLVRLGYAISKIELSKTISTVNCFVSSVVLNSFNKHCLV